MPGRQERGPRNKMIVSKQVRCDTNLVLVERAAEMRQVEYFPSAEAYTLFGS